jgi:hypothetical protein
MAELIDCIDFAADASLDHFAHSTQVAIEKIHLMVVDHEPSATVDARTPGAWRRDQAAGVTVVQFMRGHIELSDRKWRGRVIVQRQVDV